MKRLYICLLILFLIFVTGCQPYARDFEQVSSEEKIVLKFSHVTSDDSPKGRAARRWANLVAQKSEGKVEIQVFPNSTLYKDGEELEALQKNYVQIIAPATSKLTKLAPGWQLFDLPFFFPNIEAIHRLVDGEVGKELINYSALKGLKVLGFWDNGFKVMTANQPLRRVKDFQGLRFRIMDSPVLVEEFIRLGASPIPLPFSDVYSALEQNQVDGSENTPSNLYSKKFYQLQKYVTVSNHGYLGYVVLFNNQHWELLPKEIRELLISTLSEVTEWERREALRQNLEDLILLRQEKETSFYDLNSKEIEEWKNVLYPISKELGITREADLIDFIKGEKNIISTP